MTVANFMETTGAAPAAVAENPERLRGWAFGVCKAVDQGIMVRGGKHHLAALRVIRGIKVVRPDGARDSRVAFGRCTT